MFDPISRAFMPCYEICIYIPFLDGMSRTKQVKQKSVKKKLQLFIITL